MEIGQSTWSHQTVVLSERDGSEEEIFLTQSSFGGSLEPSNPMEFLCQSSDESHCTSDEPTSDESHRGAGLAQCQSARLPPMWPGFDSRTRRHMWAEFVGSLLCSERFFSGYSGFPLSSKTKI